MSCVCVHVHVLDIHLSGPNHILYTVYNERVAGP